MAAVSVIFGPPGTGKTTELLDQAERAIASGVAPEHIAFVSFTRAAVNEAVRRATKKFSLAPRDLPWFRTLHSLAYAALGLSRDAVMGDYAAFAAENGYSIAPKPDPLDAVFAERTGDELLIHAHSLVAATGEPFERVVKRFRLNVAPHRYEIFRKRLEQWKAAQGKMEYSDMLTEFLRVGERVPVRIAFIDEAQDLTAQQWQCVWRAFANVEQLFIAGDDDQTLYDWAGADGARLASIPGEQRVLTESHRVPGAVHALAQRIISRVSRRMPKPWRPRAAAGELRRNVPFNALPIESDARTWRIIARTTVPFAGFARSMEQRGILYRVNGEPIVKDSELRAERVRRALISGAEVSAADARNVLRFSGMESARLTPKVRAAALPQGWDEFRGMRPRVRRLLARVRRLEAQPRVDLSTIHGAKGAEADCVALAPDMTRSTDRALRSPEYADGEHRAFYVGVTRARERLFLLAPQAEWTYRL